MNADGGKRLFLGVVAALAVVLVLLIAELPMDWQTGAILWVLMGLPSLFFVLRVYHGYVQMRLADLERWPQQQPPVATMPRVGAGRDRGELRVVNGSDSHRRRRLL